ncbi:DEAD/DEAH box helicase [Aurantibacillus circumpalustris]|uniref:DEAD/DEAH box helicase n=1 Tax=Aurantibacillus circumpalustris TaxID=3036359 RepID=UPI00295A9E6B|nr:DEAD/DEAH box helicase [Aurantibacillus circumpalustris]
MTFDDFNFDASLVEGLYSMGYKTPTPIQAQAIPVILENKDLIACAQTGTGKTAAYLLPIIDHIVRAPNRHLNALIIAPTRELVLQIDQQIDGMGYFCSVGSIAIYGGNDGMTWEKQKHALREGVDIICATPGRLIALLQNGDINFEHLQHLVLDEADRMLDMGFFDDITTIINYLPKERQTIMFSATMPSKIRLLANKITKNPEQINIAISKPAAGIVQQAYVVHDSQKEGILRMILKNEDYQSVIIFCSTKDNVKLLEKNLRREEKSIKAFHSDLEQAEREEIMRDFKGKKLRILIGTDILSRGIDVDGISLVINYDAPPDPEDYIHRIGRTARASKAGVAITFINLRDQMKFSRIEDLMGYEVIKMPIPEELGQGPVYDPEANKKEGFKRGPTKGKSNYKGKRKSRP